MIEKLTNVVKWWILVVLVSRIDKKSNLRCLLLSFALNVAPSFHGFSVMSHIFKRDTFKNEILLCCPVLNPQITGLPMLPGELILNVSVVQSPIDAPKIKMMIKIVQEVPK